jgi:alpha-amylase
MFTSGGGPGEVHSYFSHFRTPIDAHVTAESAILDFENRIRLAAIAANEPFLFYTGMGKKYYTGTKAWSLKGFVKALQEVSIKSVEFHNRRRDFEKWVKVSLLDDALAKELKKVRLSKQKGEQLRKSIVKVAKERFKKLSQRIQATKYF